MKIVKFIAIFTTLSFILFSCSGAFDGAGEGDQGSIRIDVASPRAVTDLASMEYEITVSNGTSNNTVRIGSGNTTATIKVSPGSYTINVRAFGKTPDIYRNDGGAFAGNSVFSDTMLRGVSFNAPSITVRSGQAVDQRVTVNPVIGVTSWAQLLRVVGVATNEPTTIVIMNDLTADDVCIINFFLNITLAADGPVTINRRAGYDGTFFTVEYGSGSPTLTLGREGMRGTLTMHGGARDGNISSIIYVTSGNLVMNDGVTLTGNYANNGAAVYVSGGDFTMNGGTISNNEADFYGGGVYVTAGGSFTLKNGTISGNKAQEGGGVYAMDLGTFTLSNGTISGNTATKAGGGVYVHSVEDPNIFTKTGGIIYGNDGTLASNLRNTAEEDAGHAVYVYIYYPAPLPETVRERNSTAGPDITLDSSNATNWE